MKFYIYCDKSGKWRWRLKSGNGRVVADSGEGYSREAGAVSAVERLMRAGISKPIWTWTVV